VLITSLSFAALVLGVLAVFYLVPRPAQLLLLLAASYGFYATWSWTFPFALLAMTAVNYAIGYRLWNAPSRPWLVAGIALNIASLAALKYSSGFVTMLLHATGALGPHQMLQLLLPVGFSYRVLENISFLVDASRRQFDGFPRFLDFALYLAWFPKLLAGPIERGKAFFAQLARPVVVDNEVLSRAVTLIATGMARKLLLADSLRALMPVTLFTDPPPRGGIALVFWLLADVFVIYNDFAGYTDMVRGVSLAFGIDLPRNFAQPFFARNFSELWMRWHISLSMWLRDYVYLPLSRALLRRSANANSPAALVLPPLAAMLVSALWHQVNWHTLAWGALWGIFLFLGRIPTLWRPVVPPDRWPRWRQVLGTLGVIAMLTGSNLLFEMNFRVAGEFLRAATAPARWLPGMFPAILLILVSLALDWVQSRTSDETAFHRWPAWARSALLATVLLAVFVTTRLSVPEPFIYQGF
jgi:D-alanyl-lipoteichoic acid acyltransferase DltB (MBOAT superfamily)